jgi:hemolysin activation/secretion protein
MIKISFFFTRSIVLKLISFFLVLGLASSALGQAGRQLKQEQENEAFMKSREFKLEAPQPEEAPKKVTPKGPTVIVKKFKLEGSLTHFTKEELEVQLEPYLNQPITLGELQNAVNAITRMYRDKGVILAQVYLPPQKITSHTVTIQVVEGILDEGDNAFQVNDVNSSLRMKPELIKAVANDAIKTRQGLQREEVEEAVLHLSDFPGVTAKARMEAGKKPQSSSVVFDVEEDSLVTGFMQFDNYGDRYTGDLQLTSAVNINNLSGYGDRLTFYGNQSIDDDSNNDSRYLSLSYQYPLGYSGLTTSVNYTYLKFDAGKQQEPLDVEGEARSWGFGASYPLIRQRQSTLFIEGSLNFKNIKDDILNHRVNDQELWVLKLGVTGSHADLIGGGGRTDAGLQLSLGEADLSAVPLALEIDKSPFGPGIDGSFEYLNLYLNRRQYLGEDLFLLGSISSQYAFSNLGSSEKFSAGGIYGVRAYPNGEGLGDHGVSLNLEGHKILNRSSRFGELSSFIFFDWGRVSTFKDNGNLIQRSPNTYNLSGTGIGAYLQKDENISLKAVWSHTLGSNDSEDPVTGRYNDGSDGSNRFWFSLQYFF